MGLNVLVFRQWEEQIIESVEEQPLDRKKIEVCRELRFILLKMGILCGTLQGILHDCG